LLVFYFIFVAVGFVLIKEKVEERRRSRSLEARRYRVEEVILQKSRSARTTGAREGSI
jgi:hypothetical protein